LAEEHLQKERSEKQGTKERKNKEGKIRKKDACFPLTNNPQHGDKRDDIQ